MKNSVKKLAGTAMTAALVASALTPVAASAAEATAQVTLAKIIVVIDGQAVALDPTQYSQALRANVMDASKVKYVQDSEGNVFDITQYSQGVRSLGNMTDSLKALADAGMQKEVTPVEGTIKADGSVEFTNPTPEEKVNETFFYNLAA